MDALARSTDPAALRMLARMYADIPKWGYAVGAKARRSMLRGLCNGGRIDHALQFAQSIPEEEAEWKKLLESAVKWDPDLVELVANEIRKHRDLEMDEYVLFLRHLRLNMDNVGPDATLAKMRDTLREMGTFRLSLERDGQAELVRLHVRLGDLERAQELVNRWDLGQAKNENLWNAALEFEMANALLSESENDGVMRLVQLMRDRGIDPPQRVLSHLARRHIKKVRSSRSTLGSHDVIAALEFAEQTTGRPAGAEVWAEAIHPLTVTGDDSAIESALEVYAEAKSRGIAVDVQLARALILGLCGSSPRLQDAMRVYSDFIATSCSIKTSRDRSKVLGLYTTLFAAASRAADLTTATRLMTDLRHRSLPLPSGCTTAILIALMRQAPDHASAFSLYAHFYALNGASLTGADYSAILVCFLKTRTDKSPFAPPDLYLEIVKDMRRAGHRPSSRVLSALLQSYGIQARRTRKTSTDPAYRATKLATLHKAVKDVHVLLRLDALVEVDVPLLNSLMDAYARVGAYASAFEVWDELVERRPREDQSKVKELYGPSISIILDACGYSDQLSRARRIWAWARRLRLDSHRTWDAWIECLCRLGKIEEAAEVVCVERKNGQAGAPEPTVETMEVLLKFCWRSKEDWREVPRRVKEVFPEMWNEVREVVETKTSRQLMRRDEAGEEGKREEEELEDDRGASIEELKRVLEKVWQIKRTDG
jgi:tetratricopeptide (TPR) repeat protein